MAPQVALELFEHLDGIKDDAAKKEGQVRNCNPKPVAAKIDKAPGH